MPTNSDMAGADSPPTHRHKSAVEGDSTHPKAYFYRLLQRLSESVSLRVATVWGISGGGVVAEVTRLVGDPPLDDDPARSRRSILRVLSALSDHTAQPLAEDGGGCAVVAPVLRDGQPIAVVEAIIDAPPDSAAAISTLDELRRLARAAEEYVASLPSATPSAGEAVAADPSSLTRFPLELQRVLSVEHVAETAVNEVRRQLGCDRVSLATRRRGVAEITAVSGGVRVAPRSEAIRSLRGLASVVLDDARSAGFPRPGQEALQAGDEAAAEHAAKSGAASVAAFPLTTDDDKGVKPLGVLITESYTPDQSVGNLAGSPLLPPIVAALKNAQRHERLAASLPGRWLDRFYGPDDQGDARRTGRRIGLALLAVAVLGLIPVRYRVEARGELLPEVRSNLFAPADADVREVLVEGGQEVRRGDLLLRLGSETLDNQALSIRNRIARERKTLAALRAEADRERPADDSDRGVRLRGRVSQTEIEITGLKARLEGIESERKNLDIRAPHDGTIATFEPKSLLSHRPVQRGEELLQVLDLKGSWRLRLDCPAKRHGRIASVLAAGDGEPPRIAFVLASRPEETLEARVARVGRRAVTRPDGVSAVPIEADVAPGAFVDNEAALAGGGVVARIDCGRATLANVLFGDLFDAVRCWWW